MKTREEIEVMGDEVRRIKTAELCGWTSIQNWTGFRNKELAARNDYTDVPDYLNSLDAMHGAEKTLDNERLQSWYGHKLAKICGDDFYEIHKGEMLTYSFWHATACQRNCAFLMTML